ncbi:MAG: malto-oligosyltrehalose synthase, partial [Bacteroidota bacterium]
PDPNDEYLFYQTLVGSLPFDGSIDDIYVNRIKEYMIKAVKEAKVHTAWIKPDEEYENAVISFVQNCLDHSKSNEFIEDLRQFSKNVSWFGMLNSLSQVTLKLTLPGVPDIYQGTENWNLSLVDPDNRRAVDYELRMAQLEEIVKPDISTDELYASHADGRIKMLIVNRCLSARIDNRPIFENGNYEPLRAVGTYAQNVIAFSRK